MTISCNECKDARRTFTLSTLRLAGSTVKTLQCLRCTYCGTALRSPTVRHIGQKVLYNTRYTNKTYEQIAHEILLEVH